MTEETKPVRPERRIGMLTVGEDAIHRFLKLPKDMRIEAVYWDFNCNTWRVKVEGPQLPVYPGDGAMIETYLPYLNDDGTAEFRFP